MIDFTPLIELIKEGWRTAIPWFTVDEYEAGVLLRAGKVITDERGNPIEYGPGIHLKVPLLDKPITTSIATETVNVSSQSLTTLDNQDIVVSSAIKCNVSNVGIYLIKVTDVQNALSDVTQGKIKQVVMSKNWEDVKSEETEKEITELVKKEAKKWGIRVEYVTITTLAKLRSIRIIQN